MQIKSVAEFGGGARKPQIIKYASRRLLLAEASISGRPLVRTLGAALATGGRRFRRRELGREAIAHHAERDDRREASLRRPVGARQTGFIYRIQRLRPLYLSDSFVASSPAVGEQRIHAHLHKCRVLRFQVDV